MLKLDHIAVLGDTLDAAVAHTEAALGLPMIPGGQHAYFGTHNKLLGLGGGLYVEAISIDPTAPPPDHPRWFGLDAFTGPARLDTWICRVEDMDVALRRFPTAGVPVTLSRGALRWTMAVPQDGMLPFDGLFPALIQWHSPVPPGDSLPGSGLSLDRLVVTHPDGAALRALLGPVLDAPNVVISDGDRPGLQAHLTTGTATRLLR